MSLTALISDLLENHTSRSIACQASMVTSKAFPSYVITDSIVKLCKAEVDKAFQKTVKTLPPASNTGVEVIFGVLIDYLCTTYKGLSLEGVKNLYGNEQSEWIELPVGSMGYKSSVTSGGVRILYDGKADMGIHVVVGGKACRSLEAIGVVQDWVQFLRMIKLLGGKHTRIDVAIDDKVGHLDIELIEKKIMSQEWTSHSRQYSVFTSGKRSENVTQLGKTIGIGSRQSETYMRIYDKAAQEKVKGPWVRVEVESKGDTAGLVVAGLIENGMQYISGIVRRVLEFVEPAVNKERSRWSRSEWWEEFLQYVAKAKLLREPVYRSIENIASWVNTQVSTSLAMLMMAYGGDIDRIFDIVGLGKQKMKPRHYALVQEYGQRVQSVI